MFCVTGTFADTWQVYVEFAAAQLCYCGLPAGSLSDAVWYVTAGPTNCGDVSCKL